MLLCSIMLYYAQVYYIIFNYIKIYFVVLYYINISYIYICILKHISIPIILNDVT